MLDHWAPPALDNISSYSKCIILFEVLYQSGEDASTQRGDRPLRLTHSWLRCIRACKKRSPTSRSSIIPHYGHRWELNTCPEKHIKQRQNSEHHSYIRLPDLKILDVPRSIRHAQKRKPPWVWNITDTKLRVPRQSTCRS